MSTESTKIPFSGGVRYIVAEPFGINFLGLDGLMHQIHGCPLPKLRQLMGLMDILWAELKSEFAKTGSAIPQSLFHTNTLFQQVCIQAVELCNIPISAIDINLLCQLLFPFEYEGKEVDGLLMQLNCPGSASPSEKHRQALNQSPEAIKNSWDDMFAAVWLSSKNLKDTSDVTATMPWNELSMAMRSRNEAFADPEDKERKNVMEEYAKIVQTTKEQAKSLDLDIDFDPENPDNMFRELM